MDLIIRRNPRIIKSAMTRRLKRVEQMETKTHPATHHETG